MIDLLADRVKKERLQLNLSLQQLSNLSNISKSALQRYEVDSSKMKINMVSDLAKVFGVSPGYLMGWESREITSESLKALILSMEESGFKLEYDAIKDMYELLHLDKNEPVYISAEDVTRLNQEFSSYLKFKLQELWNKKRLSLEEDKN